METIDLRICKKNEEKYFEKKQSEYLSDGINYEANTICKADKEDLEQLAADSYFQGWIDARDFFSF